MDIGCRNNGARHMAWILAVEIMGPGIRAWMLAVVITGPGVWQRFCLTSTCVWEWPLNCPFEGPMLES